MAEGTTHNFGQVPLSCDVCDGMGIAIGYCVNCEVNLCATCYNNHLEGKPLKFFQSHEIVPVEEALRSRYSEEQCSMHPTKVYILHCNTCRQLVCPDCLTEERHRDHYFCNIDKAMANAFKDITKYAEVIKKLLPQCHPLETKTRENIKECKDWYTKHEDIVQKKRGALIKEAHRHCDELLQTLTQNKKKSMEPLEQMKTLVKDKTKKLKDSMENTHEVMKKKYSEIIKFSKDKPVIEDIDDKLQDVISIQFPCDLSKQIDSLQVVQTFIEDGTIENSEAQQGV